MRGLVIGFVKFPGLVGVERRGGNQESGHVPYFGTQDRGTATLRRGAAANSQAATSASGIAKSLLERHHTLSGGARRGSGDRALSPARSRGRRGCTTAAAPITCGCGSIEFMPRTLRRACDGRVVRASSASFFEARCIPATHHASGDPGFVSLPATARNCRRFELQLQNNQCRCHQIHPATSVRRMQQPTAAGKLRNHGKPRPSGAATSNAAKSKSATSTSFFTIFPRPLGAYNNRGALVPSDPHEER